MTGVSMSGLRDWMIKIVSAEIVQKREEGCTTDSIEALFRSKKNTSNVEELERIWSDLYLLEPRADSPYFEPSELEEIESESRPFGHRLRVSDDSLEDRIYGAWLGRCAGCLLGKPVEGWSKERIEEYLRAEGEYPLKGYFQRSSSVLDQAGKQGMFRGEIEGMPRDDDIDYTILGIHILESFGTRVTSEEIAEEWLCHLPYRSVYTAERVAYMNLVNMVPIPDTAKYLNPYREWIGAQIRGDPWGYVLPGNPLEAARLAFRDARISHIGNGIYGEMMASAMVSASFACDDPKKVVRTGLSILPHRSRLFEGVQDVLRWSEEFDRWQDCWERIKERYGGYSPVHTINNALNVILALLYGKGDFTQTVSIAVMSGWDTDCNGATAGSIIGGIVGASGIPSEWVAPLRDRVESHVLGFQETKISDLARRTLVLAQNER